MTIKDKNGRPTTKKRSKDTAKAPVPERNQPKEDRFRDRWTQLNSDVHTAINYWNDITEKYDGKLSRDQEQLKEIKCLLKELQSKIKIFND